MRQIKGFDITASAIINAGITSVVDCGIVPEKLKLKITHFANYVGDVAAWGYIQWDLMENYGIDPIVNSIKDQLGTQYLPRELGYCPIIYGGSKVQMRMINSHGSSNFSVGFSLKGYYFVD